MPFACNDASSAVSLARDRTALRPSSRCVLPHPQTPLRRIARMKKTYIRLLCAVTAAFLCSSLALAQTAPPLGTELVDFGVLGNSGVVGSTGTGTIVRGDVGSAPNTPSVTNFPPS